MVNVIVWCIMHNTCAMSSHFSEFTVFSHHGSSPLPVSGVTLWQSHCHNLCSNALHSVSVRCVVVLYWLEIIQTSTEKAAGQHSKLVICEHFGLPYSYHPSIIEMLGLIVFYIFQHSFYNTLCYCNSIGSICATHRCWIILRPHMVNLTLLSTFHLNCLVIVLSILLNSYMNLNWILQWIHQHI